MTQPPTTLTGHINIYGVRYTQQPTAKEQYMKDTIHFDAPEFYPQNRILMRVDGPQGLFLIVSEGEREAQYGEFTLILPNEFRSVFPDGELPAMSDTFVWRYNAWFAVYEERSDEVLGDPMMSLAEAVTYALDLAYGEL